MQWSADFESGLADIDVQHRYIFALLQRFTDLKNTDSRESQRYIVEEVTRFAQCHFACEERLMIAYNYGETERHIEEHAKLLFELKRHHSSLKVEPRTLSLFLCNWIVGHTLMEDRQLAAHVVQVRSDVLGMTVEEFNERVATSFHPTSANTVSQLPMSGRVGT